MSGRAHIATERHILGRTGTLESEQIRKIQMNLADLLWHLPPADRAEAIRECLQHLGIHVRTGLETYDANGNRLQRPTH